MSVPSLEKSRIKVVLLEGIHPSAVQAFQNDGYTDVEHYPKSLPVDELKAVVKNAYLLGIRSNTYLTAEVLAEALSRWSVIDNLDGLAECLAAVARWELAMGRNEQAARLYGAADALIDRT